MWKLHVLSTFIFLLNSRLVLTSDPSLKTETSFIWAFNVKSKVSQEYTFVYEHSNSNLSTKTPPEGKMVAFSTKKDAFDKIGWILQSVKTNSDLPDYLQAYWAGYLETNQTLVETEALYEISVKWICEDTKRCVKLYKWLEDNLHFMIDNSKKFLQIPFWYQVNLLLWQTKGMIDAFEGKFYNDSEDIKSSFIDIISNYKKIYLLSINPDLSDILEALEGSTDDRVVRLKSLRPSCSALLKIMPGNKDIYFAHDTWSGYEMMIRVAKSYDFPWKLNNQSQTIVSGASLSFSSYPSTWNSIDDFYIMQNGLVAIETTNGNYNKDLNEIVANNAKHSILESFRVMISNRLAIDGYNWMLNMENLNSGTYNNQWMVLDLNQFESSKNVSMTKLLHVGEQIPSFFQWKDVTEIFINKGYWASYNSPFFPEIREASGFADKEKQEGGDMFSYANCSRAKIFKRDQEKVITLKDMYQLMRYNEFYKDPLSKCECLPPYSAQLAIAARGDLNPPEGRFPFQFLKYRLHGATDTKLSNIRMAKALSFIAINSPTYETLPPFRWSYLPEHHAKPPLHPDLFMFPPVKFSHANNSMDFEYFTHLSLQEDILNQLLS